MCANLIPAEVREAADKVISTMSPTNFVPDEIKQIAKALSRQETWTAYKHEAGVLGRLAAMYPLGVAEEMLRPIAAATKAHSTPVILVHGYAHNRSGWMPVRRHLRKEGYGTVVAFNYNAFRHGIPEIATKLSLKVDEVKKATGAKKVHLVGHSLGGVVIRFYVQFLDGNDNVDTAITIASPHHGTRLADLTKLRGLAANLLSQLQIWNTLDQMQPGSTIVERLRTPFKENKVKWVAYYSNTDALVHPARSAMIRHPDLKANNIFVKDLGHLSIMVAPDLAESLTEQLAGKRSRLLRAV